MIIHYFKLSFSLHRCSVICSLYFLFNFDKSCTFVHSSLVRTSLFLLTVPQLLFTVSFFSSFITMSHLHSSLFEHSVYVCLITFVWMLLLSFHLVLYYSIKSKAEGLFFFFPTNLWCLLAKFFSTVRLTFSSNMTTLQHKLCSRRFSPGETSPFFSSKTVCKQLWLDNYFWFTLF